MKKLLFLLTFLSSCNLPPENPYHVSTFYGWSSGPDTKPFIRGLHPNMIDNGWSVALHSPGWDDQRTITEREKWFGAEAIIIHLPFGRNANQDFDFAGYTTSLKDPRLSKVTDIDSFVKAWYNFVQETGIKKIYFYYGYVGADANVWTGLSMEKKKDLVVQNVEPIRQLQISLKAINAQTGIVIDVLSQMPDPNNDNWTIAIPYIKSLGLLYGGEPWPNPAIAALSDKNYLSVYDMRAAWLFDPEINPNAFWSAPRAKISGPLMGIVIEEYPNGTLETLEHYRSKALFALKKYRNIAYLSPVDSHWTAKDVIAAAKADSTSCVDQNGFLSCCTTVNEKVTCTTSIHGSGPTIQGSPKSSLKLK